MSNMLRLGPCSCGPSHDVRCFGGASLVDAADAALSGMPDAAGGLIAVGADGTIAMPFTSAGMYRAAADAAGQRIVGIGLQ